MRRNEYSCYQVNFRIDGRVILKALHGTQEKRKSIRDKSEDLEDHHAEFACLEMFDPYGHVRTFHNLVASRPDEITYGTD